MASLLQEHKNTVNASILASCTNKLRAIFHLLIKNYISNAYKKLENKLPYQYISTI